MHNDEGTFGGGKHSVPEVHSGRYIRHMAILLCAYHAMLKSIRLTSLYNTTVSKSRPKNSYGSFNQAYLKHPAPGFTTVSSIIASGIEFPTF